MLAYIEGKLLHEGEDHILLKTGDLGYRISLSVRDLRKLPANGASMSLYLSCIFRETEQTLYGFFEMQEKELFERLLGVSGIGPRVALAFLGRFPSQELISHVHQENVRALSTVPGVGKRTAERLILELRDRLPKVTSSSKISTHFDDALGALISLGYKEKEAIAAIKEATKTEEELSALITKSLHILRK